MVNQNTKLPKLPNKKSQTFNITNYSLLITN